MPLPTDASTAISTPDPDRDPATGTASGDRLQGAPSTAAVGGHPIHPVLIPYPLTFLSSVVASDLAYRRTGDPFWARASDTLLAAGLATGVTAGLFGAVDFFTKRRPRRHPVGLLHAAGNVAALTLAAAMLRARRRQPEGQAGRGDLASSATLALLLGVTSWAGGELVYRHMVGVVGHDDQHGA